MGNIYVSIAVLLISAICVFVMFTNRSKPALVFIAWVISCVAALVQILNVSGVF